MQQTTVEENNVIPMFTSKSVTNAPKKADIQPQKETEYSFFDVKELYDLAYDRQAADGDDAAFKELLAQAVKIDMAYRRQLNAKATYKERARLNSFEEVSNTKTETSLKEAIK